MKTDLLKKIEAAALRDKQKRKNPKYLNTMGFLTRKGLLTANTNFDKFKHGKLVIKDALWAGKHLEPRIFEVLPATVARLPKEVAGDIPKTLAEAVEAIQKNKEKGPDFMGVPFEKYRVWTNLQMKDGRTKPTQEKKKMRSFRLSPEAIEKLEDKVKTSGLSGAGVLEKLLLG